MRPFFLAAISTVLLTSPCWAAQAGEELYQFDGTQAGEGYGNSIAGAGDADGDGFADIVIGSAGYLDGFGNTIGSVSIIGGATGALIHSLAPATGGDALFGYAVDGMGKLDNDGRDDIVVTAPGEGAFGVGYVFSGFGSTLMRVEFPGPVDVGADVANACDVNGDGVNDAIFGSFSGANSAGRAYVVSGFDGLVLYKLVGDIGVYFGAAVGGAGDVNQDGFADVIVSAPRASVGPGRPITERCVFTRGRTAASCIRGSALTTSTWATMLPGLAMSMEMGMMTYSFVPVVRAPDRSGTAESLCTLALMAVSFSNGRARVTTTNLAVPPRLLAMSTTTGCQIS